MSNQEKHFYEFGPFRLDPVKRRLLRDGEPVALSPKVFDTLLLLVQSSGRTLGKDDLMQMVWPDAVVEENNLTQNISALRKALGDSREASRYITTMPGLGYRFVAEVSRIPRADATLMVSERRESRLVVEETIEQDEDEPSGQEDLPAVAEASRVRVVTTASLLAKATGESVIATLGRHRKVAALVVALAVIAAAATAFWVYELMTPDGGEVAASKIEVITLMRTGTTGRASISPDGRLIVYSVGEAGRESVWLRQAAASSAQQIVPPAEVEYRGLTFSPDGNQIYLVRTGINSSESTLYRLPVLGGVPAKVLVNIDSAVSFSPDGSRMAFVRNSADESALMIADSDGGSPRKLAARSMSDYFKVPAWSPDGKVIACSAGSGETYDLHNSIIAIRVEDGTQRPASPQRWAWTRWVEWLSDGSGLLITAREEHIGPDQIWHISYPGGAAQRIISDSKNYHNISLTADSQTLVAVQTELHSSIWVAPDAGAGESRKVTFGTGSYGEACYAPDGRIIYTSQASGNWDIWTMNADGSDRKQLTADAGVNLNQAVSPDGRFIVFASTRAGVFNIWRMNSDGSNLLRLTSRGGEKYPHCSPDGKWVVYNSVDPQESLYSLWKVSVDGGEPVKLTDRDCERPVVSPDGRHIACFHRDESADRQYRVEVIPFAGGQPVRTFAIPREIAPLPYVHWWPDGRALTYAAARDGISNMWIQPLGGGLAKQMTEFKAEGRILFDWSRDGKQLVFSRRVWTSDLVLLRFFAPDRT